MNTAPVTLRQANEFVARLHRHHKPARGCVFTVGAEVDGVLRGVVTVGRPVARLLQDGRTVEVTRLCSDGTPNVCSFLLATCRRVAFILGYRRVLTYTLPEEGGASLRAAGFVGPVEAGGGNWNTKSRPRVPTEEQLRCMKHRWECINGESEIVAQ